MDSSDQLHVGYCRELARTVAARHLVSAPPVDVHAIAAALGVRIAQSRSLSGLEARMRRVDAGWMIELNADAPATSQRFSVAHEIGHLELRHDGCGGNSTREREANVFAAELLMPLSLLRAEVRRGRTLRELKDIFQVSREAMTIKLSEQGLLLKVRSGA